MSEQSETRIEPGSRSERWSAPARVLHWLVALAAPIQFWLGWRSEHEPDREESFQLLYLHFQLGVLLASLMVLRLTWRLARGAPARSPTEPRWRVLGASAAHWLMYGLLLALPLSGYVGWVWMDGPMSVFGVAEAPRLFTPPEDETARAAAWYLHVYCAWILAALVCVHVAAALHHEIMLKDRLVRRRML